MSDLSIDYIVVSLSETYVQLEGNKTVTALEDHSKTVETVLNVGGKENYTGWDSWFDGNTYYQSLFQEPLFDTPGTWQLQIKLHDSMGGFSGKVIKSAMFTFANPGPS